MRLTLVGNPSQGDAGFADRLAPWGHVVIALCRDIPLHVPQATEAVVILTDRCSHSMLDAAQLITDQRGIKLYPTEQSWSLAKDTLTKLGLLKGESSPPIVSESKEPAGQMLTQFYAMKADLARFQQRFAEVENVVLEKDETVQRLEGALSEVETLMLEKDETVQRLEGVLASLSERPAIRDQIQSLLHGYTPELSLEERATLFKFCTAELRKQHGRPWGRPKKGIENQTDFWTVDRIRTEAARLAGFPSYTMADRVCRVFQFGCDELKNKLNDGSVSASGAYKELENDGELADRIKEKLELNPGLKWVQRKNSHYLRHGAVA